MILNNPKVGPKFKMNLNSKKLSNSNLPFTVMGIDEEHLGKTPLIERNSLI